MKYLTNVRISLIEKAGIDPAPAAEAAEKIKRFQGKHLLAQMQDHLKPIASFSLLCFLRNRFKVLASSVYKNVGKNSI
jgi:hypothetical protein